MTGEIALYFVDPTFDRTEYVEILCITQLSNLAYDLKNHEHAENCNFWVNEHAPSAEAEILEALL